jgi:hypothetical protein
MSWTVAADTSRRGIALANSNEHASEIRAQALTAGGLQAPLKMELGKIPAHGQKANLSSELTESPGEASCLMAEGIPPEVKGFFLVGNFDLKRLDGVGGHLSASDELYFPVVRQNASSATYVFLSSPTTEAKEGVWLRLFDENGVFRAEKEVQIAHQGTLEGTLDQIFGTPLQLEEGYIEVIAPTLLRGFELLADAEAFHALPAQTVQGTQRLFAPHFLVARNSGSTLRLLNSGDRDVTAVLKGYTDDGAVIGTAEVTLYARKLYRGSITELLEIDPSELGETENVTGYLTVEMSGGTHHLPKVIGALTFHGDNGKWVSTLPLLTHGRFRTHFLHVAQSVGSRMFTGLAILNPGGVEATVRVHVYDEEGNRSGAKELKIAAGSRLVDLLAGPQFFGSSFEQVKGHFKVESDLPVMAFALFGHSDLRFMSAIEGQD